MIVNIKIINLIKKLIKDRNYKLRIKSSVRDKENKEVNALIKKENDKTIIEVNIDSNKTIVKDSDNNNVIVPIEIHKR